MLFVLFIWFVSCLCLVCCVDVLCVVTLFGCLIVCLGWFDFRFPALLRFCLCWVCLMVGLFC